MKNILLQNFFGTDFYNKNSIKITLIYNVLGMILLQKGTGSAFAMQNYLKNTSYRNLLESIISLETISL